jgi:prepilin-type N-terminal cleavage/methylation domain-containing protein
MIKSRQWTFSGFCSALKDEQGLNLIEVLIALLIVSLVAGVFLAAVAASSKAVIVGQEQVSAEGLAKSQMEHIQQQDYSVDGVAYTTISPIPTGYGINFIATRLDPQQDHSGDDQGLQKITVTVTHNGVIVFTLEGYKCEGR